MYRQIGPNLSSIEMKDSAVIFDRFDGNPFLVSEDLYRKIIHGNLNDDEKTLLEQAGYARKAKSPAERHNEKIGNYIDSYTGPSVLDLTISEGCNLGCHMCIHAFSVIPGAPRASKKLMPAAIARRWIDYYVDEWAPRRNLNLLSFHFGAAEPFIAKSCLLECLDYIEQKAASRKKEILINSNLTLLDRDIVSALSKHNVIVSVGLDGLKAENDSIRINNKNEGTYDIITNNIKTLRNSGVRVGVNLTLTNRNINSVDPVSFLTEMKKLDLAGVLVDIDFVLGVDQDAGKIVNLLMKFYEVAGNLDIELRGNWLAPFYNLTSEEEEEPRSFCASLRGKNIVVTPSGHFSFCTYSSAAIAPHDSYADQSMAHFIEGMKAYMTKFYLNPSGPHCQSCDILGFCGGGCRVTHEQNGAAKLMCDIYRGATSALIHYSYAHEALE